MDKIVPEPGNLLAWDRYAYVRINPIRYSDPSGHDVCDEYGYCHEGNRWWKINGQSSFSILVCGREGEEDCGSGSNLKRYDGGTFAETFILDVDNCGSKSTCAKQASDILGSMIAYVARRDSEARFTLIGHSAGADAVILVAKQAIDNGFDQNVNGVGLLDPTLTSSAGYGFFPYVDSDEIYGTSDDQSPLINDILKQNIPFFIGLGGDMSSKLKTYLNPMTTNQVEFSQYQSRVVRI